MEGEVKRQRRHSLRDCSQGEEQQKAFEARAFVRHGDGPSQPRPREGARIVRIGADPRWEASPGLCLAIVLEIMKAHGGTVRVEDHPDGGAAFTLGFPVPAASSIRAGS
jgi:hypothetical protein